MTTDRDLMAKAKTVFTTRIFKVKRIYMKVRNKPYAWHYISGPNAVMILPILDKDHVILEKQFRPTVNKFVHEFPAGRIERGETPIAAARRELEEETGYKAGKMVFMFSGGTAPAWHTETIYYYLATDLKKTRTKLDSTESIEIEVVKLSDLFERIKKGKIADLKSVTAALFYQANMKSR